MRVETWLRVRDLFERALELPSVQREPFVVREEPASAEIRAEVLRLLAHEGGEGFLTPPSVAEVAERLDGWRPAPGDLVGAFRIEQVLGRGGMGTVYTARQERPSRVVALKLMDAGLRSEDARRRFEIEAEILGRLRHPGIAAIHAAGVHRTPEGAEVPFFAMEHVEGAREIVAYAREHSLDLRARVELVREVCAAVHHAHQKGVIHRDLKPANVLVDAGGKARVIDYGVARVTEPGFAAGVRTLTGHVFGTLQYMSPEQLGSSSDDLDTRTDVYALGVILYELLAGRPPHELAGRPIAEVVAEIGERAPEAPSRHAPAVPRELDWIALKALSKERERRYASAAALAEDLERFLRSEPVLAGPPTRRYRVTKFVVRNRALVAAGTLILLSLVGGILATTRQTRRANHALAAEAHQSRLAKTALRHQNAVISALRSIFGAVLPNQDGRQVTLYEILERRRTRLDEEFGDDPHLRASLQSFLGAAYDALGLREIAEELLSEAIATMETLPEVEPTELAWLQVNLGRFRVQEGRLDEARKLFDASLPVLTAEDVLRSRIGIRAVRMYAELLAQLGEARAAAQELREVVDLSVEVHGPDHEETLMAMSHLAKRLLALRELPEAERWARQAHDGALATVKKEHPAALYTGMELSLVLVEIGSLGEAIEMQRYLRQRSAEVFGERSRNAIHAQEMLALTLAKNGEREEAEALASAAVELAVAHHPDFVDLEVRAREVLAQVLAEFGEVEGQFEQLAAGVERLDDTGLSQHQAAFAFRCELSRLDLASGRPGAAEARLRETLELLGKAPTRQGKKLALTRALLGRALSEQGRPEEAATELAACFEFLPTWPDDELVTLDRKDLDSLIAACRLAGRADEQARLERIRASYPR